MTKPKKNRQYHDQAKGKTENIITKPKEKQTISLPSTIP